MSALQQLLAGGDPVRSALYALQAAPIGASHVRQSALTQLTGPQPGGFDPLARGLPVQFGVTQRRADEIERAAFDTAMNFATVTPMRGGANLGAMSGKWDPIAEARRVAAELERQGFRVTVEPSVANGRTAYLTVFDPTTKRFFQEPVRFSDHGLGPTRARYTPQVYSAAEADEVLARAARLREAPPAAQMQPSPPNAGREAAQAAEARAAELSERARMLFPEEWARWDGRTGAAASKARQELRRRASEQK